MTLNYQKVGQGHDLELSKSRMHEVEKDYETILKKTMKMMRRYR